MFDHPLILPGLPLHDPSPSVTLPPPLPHPQANDKGDYFPLWGTCLGFELLSVLTADNDSVISPVDAENISLPLTFTLGEGERVGACVVVPYCHYCYAMLHTYVS